MCLSDSVPIVQESVGGDCRERDNGNVTVFAHELYQRALDTLSSVDQLRVSFRSVYYGEGHPAQCTTTRKLLLFIAPRSACTVVFDRNSIGVGELSVIIQVEDRTYRTQSRTTQGRWEEAAPLIQSQDDLPALVAGQMGLPLPGRFAGPVGSAITFGVPAWTRITVQGQERWSTHLPVHTQYHPYTIFPGLQVSRGYRPPRISRNGSREVAARMVGSASLYIDHLTALPIRYVATRVATLNDGTEIVLSRSHVRFRYEGVDTIAFPDNLPL